MTKIPRVTNKLFAGNADTEDVGQFGSAITGTKLNTTDIETIQALPAWGEGWKSAVVGENRYPAIQERNGIDKVFSQQIGYLLQEGIPEYDEDTTYYKGAIVKSIATSGETVLYTSLIDDNQNNPLSDSEKWQQMPLANSANKDLSNLSTAGQAILGKKVEVEALLEQNGYAKFTWYDGGKISSFVIQWLGYKASEIVTDFAVTLPYILTNAFCATTVYVDPSADVSSSRPTHAFVVSRAAVLTSLNGEKITFRRLGPEKVFSIIIGN